MSTVTSGRGVTGSRLSAACVVLGVCQRSEQWCRVLELAGGDESVITERPFPLFQFLSICSVLLTS